MNTTEQTLTKVNRIEREYMPLRYKVLTQLDAEIYDTFEHFRTVPKDVKWQPYPVGSKWGTDWLTRWFRASFTATPECDGKRLFVKARTGAYETMLFVDGSPRGVFDGRIMNTPTINHFAVCMDHKAKAGRKYDLALEAYCGHTRRGGHKDNSEKGAVVNSESNNYRYWEVALPREEVCSFYYDLVLLKQIMATLDPNSMRWHHIFRGMEEVVSLVNNLPLEVPEETWRPKIPAAQAVLTDLLSKKNGSTVPKVAFMGHSHLDSAWMWTRQETYRKAARTFSSVLNLMEQFPEFRFLQSSPHHAEMVRKEYPAIFEQIKQRIAEGRWEPNGAMLVEADCNMLAGESLIRQLLVGRQYTRKHFNYTGDVLWQPDTFGFSASLPQILSKSGVHYFVTCKIPWGEEPMMTTSFVWRGIDGSSIIAHQNHFLNMGAPNIPDRLHLQWNATTSKAVEDEMFCSYGYGDGGGGPHQEVIEIVRRIVDIEGCPRGQYKTVSAFMEGLEAKRDQLPVWSGDLYLSTHRGTLTSQSLLKRGNRYGEVAYRDAEFAAVSRWLGGMEYPQEKLSAILLKLLINQDHNAMPGVAMPEVHDLSTSEFEDVIRESNELFSSLLGGKADGKLTLVNTLSWDRSTAFTIEVSSGVPQQEGVLTQEYTSPAGAKMLAVGGLTIPAMGAVTVPCGKVSTGKSVFTVTKDKVETPQLSLAFDAQGRIVSCIEKKTGRQIVRPGGVLNRFIAGEDIPAEWDNCDVNPDQRRMMREQANLKSRTVIADGPLMLRIRSVYAIATASTITQDIVLWADNPRLDFDTLVDWHEIHILLKVTFDIDVLSEFARFDTQFGFFERPRHENLGYDRGQFDCPVLKWMDASETNFGVALLNDCKYAADTNLDGMSLTLLKSGGYPDFRGDAGLREIKYSLLPHTSAFSAPSVIRPGYEFNSPVRVVPGAAEVKSPVICRTANVIVETLKRAEEGNALVVRVYEAEKTGTFTELEFTLPVASVSETNLMEEEPVSIPMQGNRLRFFIKAFEVKTFLLALK